MALDLAAAQLASKARKSTSSSWMDWILSRLVSPEQSAWKTLKTQNTSRRLGVLAEKEWTAGSVSLRRVEVISSLWRLMPWLRRLPSCGWSCRSGPFPPW